MDCHSDLPECKGHPFYERLDQLLDKHGFDGFVEGLCARFYHETIGRPSIAPGVYFRMLLIGFFEGIDSERGIAWRCSDSLGLRKFLGYDLTQMTPEHSSLSRTRQRIDVDTHWEVFTWVLKVVAVSGLLRGTTVGIDATTLGSQYGDEQHHAPGQRAELRRLLDGPGQVLGDRDADAGGSGQSGQDPQE